MKISDEFIPETKLAGELGRDTRTLQPWRSQRVGPPYIRMGRQVLYRRDAVRHSKDGGKTFESIRTPHGDHHDLWIHPGRSNLRCRRFPPCP